MNFHSPLEDIDIASTVTTTHMPDDDELVPVKPDLSAHPLDNLNRQGRRMLAKRLRKQGMDIDTIKAIIQGIKDNDEQEE